MNVIDSKGIEHDVVRKPVPTFRHHALAAFFLAVAPLEPVSGETLKVEGTTFSVTAPDGRVLSGPDLVGAKLLVDINGVRAKIRIASVAKDPTNPDVWLHDFRMADAAGKERPVCLAGLDGTAAGFPVKGRAHADGTLTDDGDGHFELVCTSGAEGKCVRFGYRPDKTLPGGGAMRDYYNACVHLVRADYCGDGSATTRIGMSIDIYDRAGILKSEAGPDYSFEAGFGPHGAVCVAHTRVPANMSLDGLAKACPRLAGSLGPKRCSEATATGALLFVRSR